MEISPFLNKVLFISVLLLCLTPFVDAPIALVLGIAVALTFGNPFKKINHKVTSWLLKSSVVGLGFGVNLHHAIEAGKTGFIFTLFSIGITLLTGYLFGKLFSVEKKTSFLISSGTAICGGSAIAAVAPIIKADEKQMSISLGTIFILNSLALLIFPRIGHMLNMTQHQFGLWCAIAIHDTSSVVGAANKYGHEALQVATTVKLERALWIIPLSLVTVILLKSESRKINLPYFIGLFILALIISTYLPDFQDSYTFIVLIAKKGLTLTLFLIGTGLSIENIKSVGIKPFLQGFTLWIFISVISVFAIMYFN